MKKKKQDCISEICEFGEFKELVGDYSKKGYFPVDIKVIFIAGFIPSKISCYFVKLETAFVPDMEKI